MIWAIKQFFKNTYNFKGRSSRAEALWLTLASMLFVLPLWMIYQINYKGSMGIDIVFVAFNLILILPSLSFIVRRVHDINYSGWWMTPLLIVHICNLISGILSLFIELTLESIDNMTVKFLAVLTRHINPIVMLSVLSLCYLYLLIMCLAFFLKKGNTEANKYGPSPQRVA